MQYGRKQIARSLLVALALGTVVPAAAVAKPTPSPQPIEAPSPVPIPTTSGTPIPYPAYGTPQPDVSLRQQKPGVPVSVSLEQSIDLAVVASPVFASERAQYEAIRAKYYSEQGALYPSVSAIISAVRTFGNERSGQGNFGTPSPIQTTLPNTGPVTDLTGQVSLTQLIYDGGRVIAGIRTAKEADFAGRDTLLRNLQTLAFNVATAYYGLLQADATVASDALLVREFEVNEDNVRAAIRTGAEARSDLAAAEFQTAQARGNLITAQGQVIAAQATFSTTLGFDADALIQPQSRSGETPGTRALTYTDSVKQALALRPDFISAQHTVESSKENVRFAKLARFPILNLTANVGTSDILVISPPTNTHYNTTEGLGATLSYPIYDQGLTNYNVALAASQLDQANAALVQEKLTVQSDVRGALSNLISARAVLIQAASELRSAQVSLQAIQAQYKVGASTITAVITAEANLATAQAFNVSSIYNEYLAEERYQFAVGSIDLNL